MTCRVCAFRQCEGKCGLVTETRSVQCVNMEGTVYEDQHCQQSRRPDTRQECLSSTPCQYSWYATQWSQVSPAVIDWCLQCHMRIALCLLRVDGAASLSLYPLTLYRCECICSVLNTVTLYWWHCVCSVLYGRCV